jgi:hypothetical protein
MGKTYRQCLVRKKSEKGYYEDVMWIPNMYAKKGNKLKLFGMSRGEEGWWVGEVYGTKEVKDTDRTQECDFDNQ